MIDNGDRRLKWQFLHLSHNTIHHFQWMKLTQCLPLSYLAQKSATTRSQTSNPKSETISITSKTLSSRWCRRFHLIEFSHFELTISPYFKGGRYSILRSTKCFRTAKWELLLGHVVLYPWSRGKWRTDGRARRQASNITGRSCERALPRLLASDVPIVSYHRLLSGEKHWLYSS